MNNEQAKIGYWLGIARRIESDMTYDWILMQLDHVIARSKVQHMTVTNMAINAFDAGLLICLNDENYQLDHHYLVFYLQVDVQFLA